MLLGIVLTFTRQIIFLTARSQNKFFSTVMRIQTERTYTVCSIGLYRIVRHTCYLGMIITTLGLPLILSSLWCSLPAAVSIILLIVRTMLENRMLMS